ncbi:MAG: C_GCAxxG_C_C family protein [Clostridia bacterium]|nr:C_GCAxxG_C_C family protein [Clostridia bacterium]
MSKILDRAKELRAIVTPHYNCGQSVILPFAETLGMDEDTVMRFGANFGRGMKGGALCGAIAGGLVVLGLYGVEDPVSTATFYKRLRASHPEGLDCATLLRLNVERGGERKPHCDAMVYEVITIVEDMLREMGKITD